MIPMHNLHKSIVPVIYTTLEPMDRYYCSVIIFQSFVIHFPHAMKMLPANRRLRTPPNCATNQTMFTEAITFLVQLEGVGSKQIPKKIAVVPLKNTVVGPLSLNNFFLLPLNLSLYLVIFLSPITLSPSTLTYYYYF